MFYISLLEWKIIKKGRVDENMMGLKVGNIEKFERETIQDSSVYIMESDCYLLKLFSCLLGKATQEKKIPRNAHQQFNTCKS